MTRQWLIIMYLIGNVIYIPYEKPFDGLFLMPVIFFIVVTFTTFSLILLSMAAVAVGVFLYLIED